MVYRRRLLQTTLALSSRSLSLLTLPQTFKTLMLLLLGLAFLLATRLEFWWILPTYYLPASSPYSLALIL